MEIAEFLLARIAEDEAVAQEAGAAPWDVIEGVHASQVLVSAAAIRHEPWRLGRLGHVATVLHLWDLAHIARHDPARVLAECEAKRRIVEFDYYDPEPSDWAGGVESGVRKSQEFAMQCLALPYSGHPDYDPKWKP